MFAKKVITIIIAADLLQMNEWMDEMEKEQERERARENE